MTVVLFAVAAGTGAVLRLLVAVAFGSWVGTLVVNMIGSAAFGWIVAGGVSNSTFTVVGLGFCGSLTTFSTFALEVSESPHNRAVIIVTNVVGCLLAAATGAWLAR